MKNNGVKILMLFVFIVLGCSSSKNNILKEVMFSDNPRIKSVMSKPDDFEIQIIYTKVLRDKKNMVSFKDYAYNLNSKNYFYPASTVKFPIAIMALEKLNTIDNTSINTSFTIEGNPRKYTFFEEITKVFAVSDNEASTNLLEFIGFDYLNESMISKGLKPFRVSHRLSGKNPRDLRTKPITLYKNNGAVLNQLSISNKPIVPLNINNLKKGIGYIKNDTLLHKPLDFSIKNYYPLKTLHNTMKRIIFPEKFKKSERFAISKEAREFILSSMQNLPKNVGYNATEYYDGYCKFFMFGDTNENIPNNIKIYNKVGVAYGTLTDCAYIIDSENKSEFIVSATLIVNRDKVFNDDNYEYDTVGLPFLAELGRQLYYKNLKENQNKFE